MLRTVSHELFTNDVPLLDVRAEVEFSQGAFPCAINLPILTDSEREQVGICYKQQGPEAATRLGHNLVGGEVKAARIARWKDFIESHPGTHLYCFRGGQRSRIACDWLQEAGLTVPRIEGGYKAMRRFLVNSMSALPRLIVVGGKTGTGKSELLRGFSVSHANKVLDLEHLANHRGSAFGARMTPQPSQIDFENGTAVALLKAEGSVLVEDEGRLVGKRSLPTGLQERMKASPLMLLEDALENRVQRIMDEYIHDQLNESNAATDALGLLRANFIAALDAIQKRLGGSRHGEIKSQMLAAFEAHEQGDSSGHPIWIESLLTEYYDPMYTFQIERQRDRVCFRGNMDELRSRIEQLLNEEAVEEPYYLNR